MTRTPTQILAALNSVGKAPVVIPLSTDLFPVRILRTSAGAVSSDALFVTENGELRIGIIGEPAWRALHQFTVSVLAASLQPE